MTEEELQKKVQWMECPDPATPEFETSIRTTCHKAIQIQRAAFKQSRPGIVDPRTDEECLDEFLVIHWAWKVKENLDV